MAGADSTIYRGFYDTPHIQDRLRQYAQDQKIFQLIALRQVNPLSVLTIISEKFGTVGADVLPDWRFRYQEMNELPYEFTLSAASARPVSGSLIDYILLTNSEAASLDTNDRLTSKSTYMGRDLSGGATVTNVAAAFNVTNCPLFEVCRILGMGEASSAYEGNTAASGYTWVKLQRAHPAATVTGQLVAIPISTKMHLTNSVSKTNQRPNPPVAQNGSYLENVIQITRKSYGIGEHLNQGGGIKTWLLDNGAAQLDLNLELTTIRLAKTMEKALFTGRRYAAETGNESEYETGGIMEFIPSANYINAGGILNIGRINTIVSTALDTSGVRELWMFGGSKFTQNLAAAYENKRGFGDAMNMSVKYGLKVSSIEGTGRDGIVYYVSAPVLTELGYDNEAVILNLTEYNYGEKNVYGAFQIAEKVPMQDLPERAESYEENAGFMGKWRELYYAWGLIRRLANTHFRVYGVTL